MQKSLELKKIDFISVENKIDIKECSIVNILYNIKEQLTPTKRKLKYLFYANGGLVGFFSDGSVVGCPRCDLIKENVKSLYSKEPHTKYKAYDDHLTTSDGQKWEFYEDGKVKQDWAMLDYIWLVSL